MRALWRWLFPDKEPMELSEDRLEILSETFYDRDIKYYAKPYVESQPGSDLEDCSFIDNWRLGSSPLFEPDPTR